MEAVGFPKVRLSSKANRIKRPWAEADSSFDRHNQNAKPDNLILATNSR